MEIITTVAVVISGFATAVLAYLAYMQFKENRRLIEATVNEAQAVSEQTRAATQQAEASVRMLNEVQTDRELGFAPYLMFRFTSQIINGEPSNPVLELENIGRGPALNCLYCSLLTWKKWETSSNDGELFRSRYYRSPNRFPTDSLLHLASGSREQVGLEAVERLTPEEEAIIQDLPRASREAMSHKVGKLG